MSLQSMTGFGKAEVQGDFFQVIAEVKSVNHRFKDLRFRMGSLLGSLEIPMRKIIDQNFKRGSFDITINYKKSGQAQNNVDVDWNKARAFVDLYKKEMGSYTQDLSVRPTDFLRADFMFDDGDKKSELEGLVLTAFNMAMTELLASRVQEGRHIKKILNDHKQMFEDHYKSIIPLKNSYQEKVKEKLLARLSQEVQGKIDDNRFHQEVIYYMEKLDIDEEINRLSIHLQKFDTILNQPGEVGRGLDFLLQELNRETNTVGSKAQDSKITNAVVEMKMQLEKIREQALNIE